MSWVIPGDPGGLRLFQAAPSGQVVGSEQSCAFCHKKGSLLTSQATRSSRVRISAQQKRSGHQPYEEKADRMCERAKRVCKRGV